VPTKKLLTRLTRYPTTLASVYLACSKH